MSVTYISSSRSRRGIGRAGVVAAVALSTITAHANAQATFMVIENPPAGQKWSRILSISCVTNDGTVIGTLDGESPGFWGFTWHAGSGYIVLPGVEPEGHSSPRFADPTGRFIPGRADVNGIEPRPVLWIDGKGPLKLADPPPQYYGGVAKGVSWDGTIVAGSFSQLFDAEAFLWRAGSGIQMLGFLNPNDHYTTASQLPQFGDVLLTTASNGAALVGARWTAAKGWEDLGSLPGGSFSAIDACSRDGRVGAGKAVVDKDYMARWTEGSGWQNLGDPLGEGRIGEAIGISGDGWRVVGITGGKPSNPGNKPTIWDPIEGSRYFNEVLQNDYGINLTGWKLGDLFAISDNGRFVAGRGVDPQGKLQYYLVEIPPFCYADCDRSSGKGVLDLFDFLCFISKFNARDPYGNCDNDGAFDLFDFLCFINHFNAGCP